MPTTRSGLARSDELKDAGRLLIWDEDVNASEAIARSAAASNLVVLHISDAKGADLQLLASVDLVFFSLSNDERQMARFFRLAGGCPGLETVYYAARPTEARVGIAIAGLLALDVSDFACLTDAEWQGRVVPMLVRRARARRVIAEVGHQLELERRTTPKGDSWLELSLPAAETAFRTLYINALMERYPGLRQAAKRAGVSHTTLLNMLRKLNIDRASDEAGALPCAQPTLHEGQGDSQA